MRILIAHDEAFNFTYRANIDSLREMGDVTFFSPLHDSHLPPCDLLYLPGGYPELFLRELEANRSMMQQIKEYAERGGRLFAECGGFMYLCHDIDGLPMCDVLPFTATMEGARLHLGYREVNGIRGHEFHYSDVNGDSGNVSTLMAGNTAVHRYKNTIAGYIHWYWAEHGFDNLWKRLSN